MRLAILISGQPRHIDRSLLNYFDKLNIEYDVYIHYWNPDNNILKECGNSYSRYEISNIPSNLHEIIINTFTPLKIINEDQIIFPIPNNIIENETNLLNSTISQFYGIKMAFNLIDNVNKYNYIIRSRFDLHIEDIPYDFFNTLPNDVMIFPAYDYVYIISPHQNNLNFFYMYDYIYKLNEPVYNTPEHIILDYSKNVGEEVDFKWLWKINLIRYNKFTIFLD